jgi:hypothetical protein
MTCKTIWEEKGLYRVFSDALESSDLFDEQEGVYADPRFDDLRYQINDFTNLVDIHISLDDVSKIAAIDKAAALSNPNIISAIVAIDDTQLALISWYMAQAISSPWATKTFRSVEEAREWITEET